MVYRLINREVDFLRFNGEPINSVLDIGIKDSIVSEKYTSLRDVKRKFGIDVEDKFIRRGLDNNSEWTVAKIDAREINKYFYEKQFDLIILNDVIEHLTKEEGIKLIEDCKKIGWYIMLFTPEGYLKQDRDIKSQIHKCGWTKEELESQELKTELLKNYHYLGDGKYNSALFSRYYTSKKISSNED